MKFNFGTHSLKETIPFNETITCHFQETLDFTLEDNDIFYWIKCCEDPNVLSEIIKAARYQKAIILQRDDDDFRSRA